MKTLNQNVIRLGIILIFLSGFATSYGQADTVYTISKLRLPIFQFRVQELEQYPTLMENLY